jgi:hypothetical protein
MKDLFTIKTCRPIRTDEYQEVSEAIRALGEPYWRQIDTACARKIPRMIIYRDGRVENQWDASTQAFIDLMIEMYRRDVRQYLLARGIAL